MLEFSNRRSGHQIAKEPPRIPKVREFAEVTMRDGAVLTGYVFVEATARIQDLLNGNNPFFPFVDEHQHIHLINKHHVIRVRPSD